MDKHTFPDPEQARVIAHQTGACLVLAPAGSGKTRVMTERLALALERGLDPHAALCVTFTNRSAREMRNRVAARIPGRARDVRVSTFHGLCAWILRTEAKAANLPQDFVIYDDIDSLEVVRQAHGFSEQQAREFFFRLSDAKSQVGADRLSLGRLPDDVLPGGLGDIAKRYQEILADQHALDFADLVYRARALFHLETAVRDRWSGRFRWIQLDEVQDTHLSEFEVLRTLGIGCVSLAIFGDLDQTIYEWRGSDPKRVLAAFDEAFGPIRRFSLPYNYRATRALLETAERFKQSFAHRATCLTPAPFLPAGERPVTIVGTSPEDEGARIAAHCRPRLAQDHIGVLTRTNELAGTISRVFAAAGIPHLTVEQFEFFRRQEIKDALARLRLLLNPRDGFAARRILLRPSSGIGDATVGRITQAGPESHLRLSDLFSTSTLQYGDPYGQLLHAWRTGDVVIMDVESTGLDVAGDEVIEVAALKRAHSGTAEQFHRYLRPGRPVGDSEKVHGYSDAFLAKHGEEASVVFRDLKQFVGDTPVVGHNVSFDTWIVQSHAQRVGVPLGMARTFDTLDMARRVWTLERYNLESISTFLDLPSPPTHRALDDARATLALLSHLTAVLERSAPQREALVQEIARHFTPMARNLDAWRRQSVQIRPATLLASILSESGLLDYYARDPRRVSNLKDLVRYFEQNDERETNSWDQLGRLTSSAALARNVDHLDPKDRRVLVLTIHQAKGLEFDGVLVAGASDGQIPSYYAVRDGNLEEERRLFYVALTRPKRWLAISRSLVNARGYDLEPSRFLRDAGLTGAPSS